MCAIRHYWARDLNVRRGTNNFERITVKIYKDNTARLEALQGRRVRPDAVFLGRRLGPARHRQAV